MALQLKGQAGIHIASNDSRPRRRTRAHHLVAQLKDYVAEPDQQTNAVDATLSLSLCTPLRALGNWYKYLIAERVSKHGSH